MLAPDQSALALRGYQVWANIVTQQELAAPHEVRYFSLGTSLTIRNATTDLVALVRAACATASMDQWRPANGVSSTTTQLQGQQLDVCAAAIMGPLQVSRRRNNSSL